MVEEDIDDIYKNKVKNSIIFEFKRVSYYCYRTRGRFFLPPVRLCGLEKDKKRDAAFQPRPSLCGALHPTGEKLFFKASICFVLARLTHAAYRVLFTGEFVREI